MDQLASYYNSPIPCGHKVTKLTKVKKVGESITGAESESGFVDVWGEGGGFLLAKIAEFKRRF